MRSALLIAVVLGVASAMLILMLGELPHQPVELRHFVLPSLWARFLGSIGAGIREEIWFRLGVMTVFAWIISRLIPRSSSRVSSVIGSGNVIAALLFGAMHLPQAAQATRLSGAVTFYLLVGNGIVGLACGWLYWRKGILAAIVSHITVDLVLKVFVPIFVVSA